MKSATFARSKYVRELFDFHDAPAVPWDACTLREIVAQTLCVATPGRIILIEGPSGSGKSLLMHELSQVVRSRVVTDDVHLPDLPAVDCLHQLSIESALDILSRFGLGEVRNYLATPSELSTGQRFRLKLAIAFAQLRRHARGNGILLCDEFATQLDRISAMVIARTLARAIRQDKTSCAILATCHDDLAPALQPDVVIACDFGQYAITPCIEIQQNALLSAGAINLKPVSKS